MFLELNSKGLYESSGKEKESCSSCVPVLDKREFSATTAKKCTKKLDARAKLLFC